MTPNASESTVDTPDGTRLVERVWPAVGSTTGSLLLVHGLGEHARRYDHVAESLAALGIEVRSYDQRGFGRSGGPRATIPQPNTLLDDLAFMFDRLTAARRATGDDRLPFVFGHSMGGCIVARAVTGGWIAPSGMVLSSPALVPRIKPLDRWMALTGSRIVPNLRVPNKIGRGYLSHDPAVQDRLRDDTEMHNRVTPRLVAFMIRAGEAAIADAARCRVPTLLQVAGNDKLVDPAGARRFYERLPAGVGTLRVYDALYHEIFNEVEADRAVVFADLTSWIRARLT